MNRTRLFLQELPHPNSSGVVTFALVGANLVFNIIANAAFKVSAASDNARDFIVWQIVGNLAGFITELTLTGLLRDIPLHIAFTVTTGLAVLGVQIVASGWLFHEPIISAQWFGALLVIVGIGFLSWR